MDDGGSSRHKVIVSLLGSLGQERSEFVSRIPRS